MYFMCVVGGLYQVDYSLSVGHSETQEEESHDLAVKVKGLGPIESHVAYRAQRLDSVIHLVLHHLHEFAESCILVRVYHVALQVLCVVITVFDHVSDQADFEQVFVLGHLSELLAEVKLGCVVEI